jgi:hypothetical protein
LLAQGHTMQMMQKLVPFSLPASTSSSSI